MESRARGIEARLEATHWWFDGRRRLLRGALSELGLQRDARILDVGSGTGANLRMLANAGYTQVRGLDPSQEAADFCAAKGLPPVEIGCIEELPFPDAHFELVLCADVLEHTDDDNVASAELIRVLRPGGHLLVTVPAFQCLWGPQDEVSRHRRRYRRSELLERLAAAGFRVEQSFYFNFLLAAPIWLARRLLRWLPVEVESENALTPPWLNALLAPLFALDVRLASRLRPPFGVSILALARKTAG